MTTPADELLAKSAHADDSSAKGGPCEFEAALKIRVKEVEDKYYGIPTDIESDLFDGARWGRAWEQKHTLEESRSEIERLEDLLASIYETTLEADTKSRIANNMRATPFPIKRQTLESDVVRGLVEALKKYDAIYPKIYMPSVGEQAALNECAQASCDALAAYEHAIAAVGGETPLSGSGVEKAKGGV